MKLIVVTSATYVVYPATNLFISVGRAGMVARMRELRAAAIAKGMRLLSLDEINAAKQQSSERTD